MEPPIFPRFFFKELHNLPFDPDETWDEVNTDLRACPNNGKLHRIPSRFPRHSKALRVFISRAKQVPHQHYRAIPSSFRESDFCRYAIRDFRIICGLNSMLLSRSSPSVRPPDNGTILDNVLTTVVSL